MADPGAIMSYYDLYDGPFSENLSNILTDYENPSLLDLPEPDHIGGQGPSNTSDNHNPDHVTLEQNSATNWDLPIDFNVDQCLGSGPNNQPGPSRIRDHQETNNNDPDDQVIEENLEFPQVNNSNNIGGNSRTLPTWPSPPVPFNCTCCQVLREIIHVNEFNNYMKLEIHGRLGMICHAIWESRNTTNNNVTTSTSSGNDPRFEMFDFCRQSIEDVKRFLVEYCSRRKVEGYVMLHDPLSIFYEALCVGLEWDELSNNDFDFVPTSPPHNSGGAEENYTEQQGQEEQQVTHQQEQTVETRLETTQNDVERNSRISLAEQRQRTGKLTLMDLREYLHLTIEDAAKAMNVCPTVLKKICRRHNLPRWPYRKIRSIKRQISSLRPNLESNDAAVREQAQAEIDRLRQEATNICAGVDVVGL
ncbi:RWP-RK domain containing protein [Trema orientale]|uniref:RWP-RK domain containing protein n=1 Tax=Trema orientale TaxID=63057 RepID=A0A2P5FDT6_TREOI|nr:RWP-RK domain containing protein [Trema orientale]